VFSGDKSFDEPNWGTFDTNDDIDSVWAFNANNTTKEVCQFSHLKVLSWLNYFLFQNMRFQFCICVV